MVYIAFVCFSAPLALMLPVLKGQARWLVAYLLIGSYLAVISGEVNIALKQALGLSSLELSLCAAPVVEEMVKALPVLAFALLSRNSSREDVLAIAFSCGVGFAITENAFLMMRAGEAATVAWALARGLSTSLMHGLCTLTVGVGFTFARTRKKLFYTGTFGLIAAAITYHATFNLLISATGVWSLIALACPLLTYAIAYGLYRLMRAKGVSMLA